MIASGWLFAILPERLIAVGPADELNVDFEAAPPDPEALLRVLREGQDANAFARASGLSSVAAAELLAALRESGALVDTSAAEPEVGHSLSAALLDGPTTGGTHEIVWTAEEALLLPRAIDGETRTAVLRAFVAGCEPFERLRAYSGLTSGSGAVAGDAPAPETLAARLAECPVEPGQIAVIALDADGQECRVTAEDFELLDASAAHRLGPIARIHPAEDFAAEGMPDLHYTVAEIAEAIVEQPTPAIDRRVQGSGTREHSQLTARAEGAERFALAVHSAAELRTAAFSEVEAAVDPRRLFAYNDRQLRERGDDPAHHGERLWCAAETIGGERRWVPAELAGVGVERALPITSSGVAAHSDPALARAAALNELVERDAFMWTWIQRVSRERIAPFSVPEDVTAWTKALAGQGWATHWVNLTMEFQPTILCCLVHAERGLVVGAASRPDAVAALRKATLEALVLALRFKPDAHQSVDAKRVRSTADHLLLHMDPLRAESSEFLYSSGDSIELSDLSSDESIEHALERAGIEPVLIDLTIARTRPFHVVRAVTPGLVPLTFGWDSEPLGLESLTRPRARHDGSMVGVAIDLSEEPARDPHPFA
jgi:ribosomal protein S12 methylthiotransferase accessory factor